LAMPTRSCRQSIWSNSRTDARRFRLEVVRIVHQHPQNVYGVRCYVETGGTWVYEPGVARVERENEEDALRAALPSLGDFNHRCFATAQQTLAPNTSKS
jgi:hypothetical protein